MDQTARFNAPGDLVVTSEGTVYAMDRGNLVVRRIAASGEVSTLSGSFDAASRLALDASGRLLVLSGTDVYRIASDGSRAGILAYPPSPGSYRPVRIATDAGGRIYLLQQYRNVFRVDRIDSDGNAREGVYAFSTEGSVFDMAVAPNGDIAVATLGPVEGSSRITIVPASLQPAAATSGGISNLNVPLQSAGKLTYDSSGNLYLADVRYATTTNADNSVTVTVSTMRVARVSSGGSLSVILSGFPDGSGGSRTAGSVNDVVGIALSGNGDIYLSDPFANAIYRVTQAGDSSLFAGKPGERGSSD